MRFTILSLLSMLILASCMPTGDKEINTVKVKTSGAQTPVEIINVGGEDKGEFLIGGDPVIFTVEIKNNNSYYIDNLSLELDPFATAGMKFEPGEDGKSVSPGASGTCTNILKAGQSCTFKLFYQPTFAGKLTQPFTVRYRNLIENTAVEGNMILLAGEAASIIFEGDRINYDFGYMERTIQQPKYQDLTLTNAGGLTAKNLTIGEVHSHASRPFEIIENDCPENLPVGESCNWRVKYIPKNYGPSAPDGDNDIEYDSSFSYSFVREPNGGTGNITAYFFAESTKILGKVKTTSVPDIQFNKITVGNRVEQTVKIQNDGYKEFILHSLDIYDASDNLYARCFRFDGTLEMVCQDPNDIGPDGTNYDLDNLPIKVEDLNDCFNDYDDLVYERLSDESLSNPALKQISGKTAEVAGGSCFFKFTFQPSVTKTTDGTVTGYKVRFRYDTTWKNTVDMAGVDNTTPEIFRFLDADWISAAKLTVYSFDYGSNKGMINGDPDDDTNYFYDLGRVALISNPTFKQVIRATLENMGQTQAEVLSIKDGDGYEITNISTNKNTYYQNLSYVGCDFITENESQTVGLGGKCNFKSDIIPLASSTGDATADQAIENDNMFDIVNGYPDNYKRFVVTYRDGALFNDDGTDRAPRTLTIDLRALLVRKGFLVYEDFNGDDLSNLLFIAGNTYYRHINLLNGGTGPIPYITTVPETLINGNPVDTGLENPRNSSPYIYEFIDTPSAENGADKDCYDIVTPLEGARTNIGDPNLNATDVLPLSSQLLPGESCSATIRIRMRSTDVYDQDTYWVGASDAYNFDFNRYYDSGVDSYYWREPAYGYTDQTSRISFKYDDGDGIADPTNGYNPEVPSYGNTYVITGANDGVYLLDTNWSSFGRLMPKRPSPMIGAVICRNTYTEPEVAPDLTWDEWGLTIPEQIVPETCIDYHYGEASNPESFAVQAGNYVKANYNDYDYIYYAGTYKAGESYAFGFDIGHYGAPVEILNSSYTGDTGIIVRNDAIPIGSFSGTLADFDFTFEPSVAGTYETNLLINYKNARYDTDSVTRVNTERSATLRVKIVADVVPATEANYSVTVQDYQVTYDPDTGLTDDTVPRGAPYPVLTYHNSVDPDEFLRFKAIRGAEVYDKKVLTITNIGATTIKDAHFFFKQGVFDRANANSSGARGYEFISNDCDEVDLAPAASCDIEIHFKASVTEPLNTNIDATITYDLGVNQYQQDNFRITFVAGDPAILEADLADENIEDESGNIIMDSYILDLGYFNQGHPVIIDHPTQRESFLSETVVNTSTEKASFLAQWETFTGLDRSQLPGTAKVTIYNQNNMEVVANRACFFGDDELDGAIDADKKGFNSESVNPCLLDFHIDLGSEFFNQDIDTSQRYLDLEFYNNERASKDIIHFHFRGFVEANRSSIPNRNITGVTSSEDGTISFTFENASTQNPSWGSIIGYRVFYSQTIAPLYYSNIYKGSTTYVDTVTNSVTISGLTPGRYYYFRPMVRRSTGGEEYVSRMGNMNVKTVISPPSDYFYSWEHQAIISKDLQGESGTKAESIAKCNSETINIFQNGSIKSKSLALINNSMYELIDSDPSYSNYYHSIYPHWMSDPATDIEPFFPNFLCSQTLGTDAPDNELYIKSCNDCSCNTLSLIRGGDGEDFFPNGYTYMDGDAFQGQIRCYMPQ